MKQPKKAKVIIFDQYNNPMVEINLEMVDENKIESILKKYYMNNLFSENNWGLFKQEFKSEFESVGAMGIQIERLNWEDKHKDFLNMTRWEIKILGDSPLNKHLLKPSRTEKDYIEDVNNLLRKLK
ncbi:MAG: hypothetical protein WC438_02955 [Candidatus Pacearchaeota archaeon]